MSDEEKVFQYVKRMLPLFRAVVKFCTTNRLFAYIYMYLCAFILALLLSFPEFLSRMAKLAGKSLCKSIFTFLPLVLDLCCAEST